MTEAQAIGSTTGVSPEEDALELEALRDWGLPLKETYKLTLRFYKANEGKSVQLQYNDRLKVVAFTQQSLHGPFTEDRALPLGTLDVIGRDRRNAWAALGDMSKSQAMKSFVDEVMKLMPSLQPYLQTQRQEAERTREELDRAKAESAAAAEREADELHAQQLQQQERQRQEEQRRKIQDALNQQTFEQFKSFADQQYPNNPDQQAVMIRHLQEQHFHQYMQQIYQQQMEAQADHTLQETKDEQRSEFDIPNLTDLKLDDGSVENVETDLDEKQNGTDEDVVERVEHVCSEECDYCQEEEISPASMWTKKEIDEFKESIRNEGGDSIIKVGHGETVTVRVPTHKDGSALFWEFATDNYDIAFGLFFEWIPSEESEVSVHISDSEDEDINEDDEDESGDPEVGARATLVDKGPPTSVIIPIYRRDCHEEVYAGTHTYPGQGVYLLKFDNTYSLWRSKTLFYRVYYTK